MISSYRLMLAALQSSDLEGLNLGDSIAFYDNDSPSHSRRAIKFLIISLQSSQHCHILPVSAFVPLVAYVTYFFQQTLNVGVGFFHVNCMSKRY